MTIEDFKASQERDYESGKNETRYCKLQKVEEHLNPNQNYGKNKPKRPYPREHRES
jgi:hypothetical protein